LLERIDKDLEECDASTMAPLASVPPAAGLDELIAEAHAADHPAPRDPPPLATGGPVYGEPMVLNDYPGPPPFVMPVDREPAAVGFDEPAREPRPPSMRGWLSDLFERWSR
jgi:hypothetical protein